MNKEWKKYTKRELTKEEKERKTDLDVYKNKMRYKKRKTFPYSKQLKDKRWFAFREKVFKKKGRFCEICGSTENLQVHHKKYRYPLLAWEYKMKDVMVLCRRCHAEIHGIKVDYTKEIFGI